MTNGEIKIPAGRECYVQTGLFRKILKSCPMLEIHSSYGYCKLFKKKITKVKIGLQKVVFVKTNQCQSSYLYGGIYKSEEE